MKSINTRYEQAQQLMRGMLSKQLVMNDAVFAHWLSCENKQANASFWYLRETATGKEFRLVNAKQGTNDLAFDHTVLSQVLMDFTGKAVNPDDLPIVIEAIQANPLQVLFKAFGKDWLYEPERQPSLCEQTATASKTDTPADNTSLVSPDGQQRVFVRNHNLWILDQHSGDERALTEDGNADYNYATAPQTPGLQAQWSPDGKKLFTHRLDTRSVFSRPLIHHIPEDGSIRPQVTQHKQAYPGDDVVESYELLVIDVKTATQHTINDKPLPLYCLGQGFFTDDQLGWWASNSTHLYFVDIARGAQSVKVMVYDLTRQATTLLFEETSDTFVKLTHDFVEPPLFLPLPETNELIWFSERSGWGHLYLYDLNHGELKHQITGLPDSEDQGDWLVRKILYVNPNNRELIIQTSGRDKAISPYYLDICRVNIDTGELTTLAAGDYDYQLYHAKSQAVGIRSAFAVDHGTVNGVSPAGDYVVATRSRVDIAPESVLINTNSKDCLILEIADTSGLPVDWCWPQSVNTVAADGKTDIHGVVYYPQGYSPTSETQYPVLDYSSGHPGFSFIPHASFINGPCFDFPYLTAQAYAALGFIVVALEGRGGPGRSKAFSDHSYGNVAAANELSDRVTGIQQLAERIPAMNLSRVGLVGGDGITSPVYGLLQYPDFYHVGICICLGDARFVSASEGELCEGRSHFISRANNVSQSHPYPEDLVERLKGKLFLIHGMLDTISPPAATLRLIDALQKANKDFDMLLLPTMGHDVPSYVLRRSWDYLVEHLRGETPPKGIELVSGLDLLLRSQAP